VTALEGETVEVQALSTPAGTPALSRTPSRTQTCCQSHGADSLSDSQRWEQRTRTSHVLVSSLGQVSRQEARAALGQVSVLGQGLVYAMASDCEYDCVLGRSQDLERALARSQSLGCALARSQELGIDGEEFPDRQLQERTECVSPGGTSSPGMGTLHP
jgi:hypothetical protein